MVTSLKLCMRIDVCANTYTSAKSLKNPGPGQLSNILKGII